MKQSLQERISVVYEDTDVIVVDKASGVLSYPVEGRTEEGAIQLIRRYWKAMGSSSRNLYLLHRLDEDTSGLMVFAKTTLARESLRKQFDEHSVLRSYVAATGGVPQRQNGRIETMLGRDQNGRRAVRWQGREAITYYEVLRRSPGGRALIRCRLETGRTHQVRIHMAHIGAPVIGDALYGKRGPERLMLHSEALGFFHPRSRRFVVFRTPVPQLFLKAIAERGRTRETAR